MYGAGYGVSFMFCNKLASFLYDIYIACFLLTGVSSDGAKWICMELFLTPTLHRMKYRRCL